MSEHTRNLESGAISWWNTISPKDGFDKYKGDRAELRRCHSTTDVMFLPSYHLLLEKAGADRENDDELKSLATLAWVLSWVSSESSQPFPAQLAVSNPDLKSKQFQPTRFRRLLETSDWDELGLQLIRALQFTKRSANVHSLVESILSWKHGTFVREKWALDYYRIASSEKKSNGVE